MVAMLCQPYALRYAKEFKTNWTKVDAMFWTSSGENHAPLTPI